MSDLLIVDDTPNNLRLLMNLMVDQGHEVRTATNGSMALRSAKASPPDLVLLDINMPNMDGYEVCQHLKAEARTQAIPVIFLSALSDTLDKVKAFEVGGVDYITKPFQVEEVLLRVKTQLSLCQMKQQLEKKVEDQATELNQAQLQIIQSEKMASLGDLVAGIAHEVNNPLSFLSGSVQNASQFTQDLFAHLQLYRELYPDTHPLIIESEEEIDLLFLQEDLPKLLQSMSAATQRIRAISDSLRSFSRADTEDKISADLHEGLDSTLLMLKYRLSAHRSRPDIKVVKSYSNLPMVECFPGQLNQVFMNIFANAIDAFDEMFPETTSPVDRAPDHAASRMPETTAPDTTAPNTTAPKITASEITPKITPKIMVTTEAQPDERLVTIRIRDNGKGMSPDVQARIFDRLFTTKTVGKGTGLGLAIAHQIVSEAHGGSISVWSEPDQGTEFCIRLPVSS